MPAALLAQCPSSTGQAVLNTHILLKEPVMGVILTCVECIFMHACMIVFSIILEIVVSMSTDSSTTPRLGRQRALDLYRKMLYSVPL